MEGSKPAVNVSLASQQHILQFCQGSMNLHFVTGPRRQSLSHLAGLLLPWVCDTHKGRAMLVNPAILVHPSGHSRFTAKSTPEIV